MTRDPVAVGMRTDSAMNPISRISGITRANVLAAPVEVRMMLPMVARVLRQVVGAGPGHAVQHGLGARGRVDRGHGGGEQAPGAEMIQQRLDHVRQAGGGAGSRGNHLVPARIVVPVVDAHDRGHRPIRHALPLVLDFERRRDDHFFRAGLDVAQAGPLGIVRRQVGVQEPPGGVHHHPHPLPGPVDLMGEPRLCGETSPARRR